MVYPRARGSLLEPTWIAFFLNEEHQIRKNMRSTKLDEVFPKNIGILQDKDT